MSRARLRAELPCGGATGTHSWTDCLGRRINRVPRRNYLDLRVAGSDAQRLRVRSVACRGHYSPIMEPVCLHSHAASCVHLVFECRCFPTEKREDCYRGIVDGDFFFFLPRF